MAKYSIGIDFGTLSGRAVIVNVTTGEEIASEIYEYPHGVMDEILPSGERLDHDWALQHPQDYIDVLKNTVPKLLQETGINPSNIIGVGTDFTACTLIPVKADGTPLCFLPEYINEPHAYAKLWKHHSAQDEANKVNEIAKNMGEDWIDIYGGKVSSEWVIPKIWQVLDEAPQIYDAADKFIEAGDWITWQLTGVESRNSCAAGYKAFWNKRLGYPSNEFFRALDPRLENVVDNKLSRDISTLGTKAGEIDDRAAILTGLKTGTAVSVSNIDAHAGVPAAGIDGPGKMFIIIGTSTCHLTLSEEERRIPGISGVVEDGIIPGFFSYEAGQTCVGDHFEWFIENCLPAIYLEEAKRQGMNVHAYLREKVECQRPGESGLLALDWWNGNRSVLNDADLSGMILGMTLQTKPEEIYRALVEATAYGTRVIIDTFKEYGVPVDELYAAGGIAHK
ncbi:MAG: ribulokinase, partial [Clostridiales bacterium]|nr:ribulokinase [Clostridiales bacterium]